METYGNPKNPECIVVYDCGGKNTQVVNNVINQTIKKDRIIDALFISHYDSDHINGVQHLLKRCHVKHLFLPCQEKAIELVLSIMNQRNKIGPSVLEFYQNPTETIKTSWEIKEVPKITYVNPREDNDKSIENQLDEDEIDIDNIPDRIKSGTIIKLPIPHDCCWRLIPFNRRVMTDKEWGNFINLLGISNGTNKVKVDDVLNAWKHKKIKLTSRTKETSCSTIREYSIKDAFIKAIGFVDINELSMVLYSGPIRECGINCIDFPCHCHSFHLCPLGFNKKYRLGCLYTGDYNAKQYFNDLKMNYQQVWDNIGIIQIPHHGSFNNYSDNLVIPMAYHVIPYGDQGCAPAVKGIEETTSSIAKKGGFVVRTDNEDVSISCCKLIT